MVQRSTYDLKVGQGSFQVQTPKYFHQSRQRTLFQVKTIEKNKFSVSIQADVVVIWVPKCEVKTQISQHFIAGDSSHVFWFQWQWYIINKYFYLYPRLSFCVGVEFPWSTRAIDGWRPFGRATQCLAIFLLVWIKSWWFSTRTLFVPIFQCTPFVPTQTGDRVLWMNRKALHCKTFLFIARLAALLGSCCEMHSQNERLHKSRKIQRRHNSRKRQRQHNQDHNQENQKEA